MTRTETFSSRLSQIYLQICHPPSPGELGGELEKDGLSLLYRVAPGDSEGLYAWAMKPALGVVGGGGVDVEFPATGEFQDVVTSAKYPVSHLNRPLH